MKLGWLVLSLWAGTAHADNPVASEGPLSNDDFYNLVTCAAPPGGACQLPLVTWADDRAADLTVSLYEVVPGYPPERAQALADGLNEAISQINAAGSALKLRMLPPGKSADVNVRFLGVGMGEQITGTGMTPPDGSIIEAALVQLFWNGNNNLTQVAIIFPRDIAMNDIASITLEELTQAMGMGTDIDNPWYESRSIFSETSNALTRLGDQDLMTLRRSYPLAK